VRHRVQNLREVLTETIANWLKHRSPVESAALAYYTLFSLAPVLLVVIAVAGAIWGPEAVRGRIVAELDGLMGRDAAGAVQAALESAALDGSGVLATVVGLVTLLLGATAVFVQLQDALNQIWEVAPQPGRMIRDFLKKRLISFGMLLCIGFLLLVSLGISAGLAALQTFLESRLDLPVVLLQAVNLVFSFVVIAVLFGLIYRILPDARITTRDVAWGAVAAALLFTLGKYLIGLYIGQTGVASAYGAAGSLVVILVWVYYSSLILLLGAELTRVYSRRYRPTRVQPEPGAMRKPSGVVPPDDGAPHVPAA
jgi:membrane protein